MAEYIFCVQSINTSLNDQTITINCSLDVDEETVTSSSIFVVSKITKAILPIDIEVNKKKIILKILDDVVLESEYALTIQNSIKSIVGDQLNSSVQRTVIFKSTITSTINVIKPVNFEKIDGSVLVKWKEIGKNPTNCYYYEISTENTFYNIFCKGTVDKTNEISEDSLYSLELSDVLENGQYYIRIRAIDGSMYGVWSDPITFTVGEKIQESPLPVEDNPPELPEILDFTDEKAAAETIRQFFEAQRLFFDEETPESFVIKCSSPIVQEDLQIIVERKKI